MALRISAVVCAHNESRYLPACLHSLLAQTRIPDEIIVVNKRLPQAKHLYSWKTLLRCEKAWPAIRNALRHNVDVALTLYRNGSWPADTQENQDDRTGHGSM